MTPRLADGHLQGRVYRALRQHGESSAKALAHLLNENEESCRKACQYLGWRGYVTKIGVTRGVTYTAVPKRRPPKDMRGKSARSRNHRGAIAWASWLRMMTVKHGPSWRPPVRGIALERAWRRAA